MKPSRVQYMIANLIAKDWPAKIYFAVAALLGLGWGINMWKLSGAGFTSLQDIFLYGFIPIILAPVLAVVLSFLPGVALLSSIIDCGAKLNGAPFHVGDRVQILAGPHQRCVVRIYEIWNERRSVRVDLGEQAEKSVKDVFSYAEVCRERVI